MAEPGRWRGERVFVAVIGAIFAIQFAIALTYPADPRLFPLIIAGAGVLLAAALGLGFGLGSSPPPTHGGSARFRMTLALVLPPAFALLLWALGFWPATIVTIPAVAWLLGYRNLPVLTAVTLSVAAAIGFLFPLVNVALPAGALFARHHL